MASYSIFPKPGPPAEQACQPASKAPQSRFVEGSMNDRISNVPPRDFLGPEDLAAYERQFYLDNPPPPPRSSSSSDRSSKKASGGFFAPLWQKLHLTRAKSASSMTSNKSKRPVSQQSQRGRQEQQQEQDQAAPPAPGNPLAYPTREEVMENYKSLMDSGFFTAHAIQGGRHRPRTASGQLAPVTESPAPPTKSFTQHMAQNQHQQQRPSHPAALAFSSIPYSVTKAPASGDPPLTLYPRPSTATRPRSNNGRQQHTHYHQHAAAASAPTPPGPDESPQRGTKRGVADIAGGAADREWAETGARKLVKKLRKSASRISVDMSLGAAGHRSAEAMTASRPPTRNRSSSSSGGGAVGPPSANSSVLGGKETPRHSVSTMRSFSSSWKPGASSENDKKKSGGAPNRLSKAKKVLGGGRRRRRSTSRSPGPVSHPPAPQRAPPSVPSAAAARRQAGPPSPSPGPESMVIDSPPTTRPSFDGVVNGLSVPSFHYPQRIRARPLVVGGGAAPEPLSVVPDANRGIPSVPRIPIHFKHRRNGGASGSGSGGIRDSGVGDVENCESW